jgi:hypothetical protein
MAKTNEAFTNFAGGQYSPHLAGRYDSPLYRAGVEKALNVIARPQGGFIRRPGTKFIANGASVMDGIIWPTSRLIAFNVSPTEAYLLALSPSSMEIFQNDELIKSINVDIPDGGFGIRDLGFDIVRNIIVFTHRKMHPTILRAPTTTEAVGTGAVTAFSTGFPYFNKDNIIVKVNDVVQTITTDYTIAEPDLIGGQYSSATINFVSAPADGAEIEIIRDWEYVDYPAIDGPWEEENTDPTKKIALVGGTGTVGEEISGAAEIFATNRKGTALKDWFDPNWKGRRLRLFTIQGGDESYGDLLIGTVITAKRSFNVTINASQPVNNKNANSTPALNVRTRRWALSAWYENNYPEKVAFHEGRLYFFRENDRWATVANDLFSLSPNSITTDSSGNEIYITTDDSAIYFKSADSESSSPAFAISGQVLHVGTNTSHLTISGVGRSAGISPSNLQQVKESNISAASIRPVIYDDVYFVDNERQSLYKTSYRFQTNSYFSEKINNFDDEILYPRIKSIALLKQPFPMIWCVMDDGTVRVCTINEIDSVYSWTELKFTSFDVWDIAVLKTANDREQVYLISGAGDLLRLGNFRTNAGGTYRRINYRFTTFSSTSFYHTLSNVKEEEFLTDQNTTYEAGNLDTTTIASNQIAVDMSNYKQYKRNTGTQVVANDYEIGRPFYAEIILRPINKVIQSETNLSMDKQILKVMFNLWRTLDFKVKEIKSTFVKPVTFRDGTSDPFTPTPVFTGIKPIRDIGNNVNEIVQLKIYQDECVPFNLNSVVVEFNEAQ